MSGEKRSGGGRSGGGRRGGGGRGNLRSVATILFRASLFRKTWGPSREEAVLFSRLVRIPRLPGGEGRENDLRVKLAGFMTRDKRRRGEEERKETRTLSSHFAAIDYPLFPLPLLRTFESASLRSKRHPSCPSSAL